MNIQDKEELREPVEVTLVDGEKVKLDLHSVCFPDQIFVRLGNRLIAGIIKQPSDQQAVYVWHERQGIYYYLGDISFHEIGDEYSKVVWLVHPIIVSQIHKEAMTRHFEQCKDTLSAGSALGSNHFGFLSSIHED